MVAVHLTEVGEVEEGADANRVHRVLGLRGDPLRVEVLLGDVARQRAGHRDQEGDRAGDPHAAAAPAPGRHPVLAPQVDDHREEEQLHAPHVNAVEEVPDAGLVPPGRALQREDHARGDDHDQRGDAGHPEYVDPGGHVGGLAVGQKSLGWQRLDAFFADFDGPGLRRDRRGGRPGGCELTLMPRLRRDERASRAAAPGNGSRIARTNTISIRPMTTTFATDRWMKFQSTVCAGWLRLKTAPITLICDTSPLFAVGTAIQRMRTLIML